MQKARSYSRVYRCRSLPFVDTSQTCDVQSLMHEMIPESYAVLLISRPSSPSSYLSHVSNLAPEVGHVEGADVVTVKQQTPGGGVVESKE